jgi:glycosyltransferase involved in cell wall biosynthesis
MAPIRTAFVMEQALGHVTHYRNLRAFADQQADISPVWLPIPYEVHGMANFIPVLSNMWSVRASWRGRRALDSVRTREKLDAVMFHTQVASLFSIPIMRQIPTLISLDATPINYDMLGPHYNHRPAGRGFVDRQKFEWNRRTFQAAARLVTWSEWARKSLVEDYGIDDRSIRVVPPGANPSYFELGRCRAARGTARETRGPVRLLFVGGDFHRKGGLDLLKVINGSLAGRVQLDIVTKNKVEPQAGVIVHDTLGANSPELLRLFSEADVFVLPTYADCLGLVLMEAAASGLPVITTRVGAINETVCDGESGYLLRAGDLEALHAAISSLVDHRQLREQMGRTGFVLAREKFDAQRNNRLLLDLIGEVVGAHPVSGRAA